MTLLSGRTSADNVLYRARMIVPVVPSPTLFATPSLQALLPVGDSLGTAVLLRTADAIVVLCRVLMTASSKGTAAVAGCLA